MKLVRLLLVTILMGLVSLGLVTPVYATVPVTNPISMSIDSVRIFQNVFETGDELVVVEEHVMYTADPSTPATQTFSMQFNTASGNFSRPLQYYDYNFNAIYLTAAEAVPFPSAGSIVIMGSPTYFSTISEGVNQKTYVLSGGEWVTGTTAYSQSVLGSWCLALAQSFQTSWTITLLVNNLLNSTAAPFFLTVIPGLETITPTIFAQSTSYITTSTPAPNTKAYETDLLSRIGPTLSSAITGLSAVTNIPYTLMSLLLTAIMFFIVGGSIFAATGSPALVIPISFPFLFAATVVGLIPLSVIFFIVGIVVVIFGITFVLGRIG